MAKIYSGASISYGSQLPPTKSVTDGSLFFKTDDVNGAAGLYIYSFQQDINSTILGDQVGAGWAVASTIAGSVLKTGDVMTGSLEIPNLLRITAASGAQRIVIGNQNGNGTTKPNYIQALDGILTIGTGTSWTSNQTGGTLTAALAIDPVSGLSGLTWFGNQVWHAGNDGVGSALDANYLQGQTLAYIMNAANQTGTVPVSRGGTGNTSTTQGGVVYGNSSTAYAATAAGTAGQILGSNGSAPVWLNPSSITVGAASTATLASTVTVAQDGVNTNRYVLFTTGSSGSLGLYTYSMTYNPAANLLNTTVTAAQNATNATNAVNATNAGYAAYLRQNGNGSGMTFNWSGQGGSPTWLWGGTDGINMYVYSPANLAVNWTSIVGRPTGVSQFTNDSGYITAGSNTFNYQQLFMTNNNTSSNASSNLISASSNGSGTFMTFLRQNYYAINMGLDSDNVFRFGGYSAPANLFQMDMAGNLTMLANITAYSDIRMKTNIAPIRNAIAKVQQLDGVTFERKDNGARGTGLIAQELREVLPEAVMEDKDGMLSVAYGNVVGLLVQAIKEQQAMIEALRSDVNRLTNR